MFAQSVSLTVIIGIPQMVYILTNLCKITSPCTLDVHINVEQLRLMMLSHVMPM
jgi:hypothetical protein